MKTPLILASASPRRAALLQMLGFAFTVQPSGASEVLDSEVGPRDHVVEISKRKAEAVAGSRSEGVVLGADTVVVLDDTIIEKPDDTAEAEAMLTRLSGRTHQVYTGVTLINAATADTRVDAAVTDVTIRSLDASEIRRYAATGEPLDKAGAYAAQGLAAVFIESVTGCFYNVVGLPLALLWNMLERLLNGSPWDHMDLSVEAASPTHLNLVTHRSRSG